MRNVCVHTNFTCGSGDSSTSNHSHHGQYSQGAAAPFRGVSNGGSSLRGSSDSIGSSRGSTGGMRMSSGPDLAGVGIFFQQEPNTGKVYVANIVENGSADRSGVICVNDVIVKVDNDDVQGQPLSMLRNLILGKQGSYVVLAFRRMTGSELYYFDVELLRGSPEYFESLKKTQEIAAEKEKLITQVRQQEQEIQALKQTSLRSSAGAMPSTLAVPGPTLEGLKRELTNKVQEAKRLEELIKQTREDSIIKKDAEDALSSLSLETQRTAEALQSTETSIVQMQGKIDEEHAQQKQDRARLEKQLAEVQRTRASTATAGHAAAEENSRLKANLAQRKVRDDDVKRRLAEVEGALKEAQKSSEESTQLLQALVPGLDTLHRQLMVELGR